MDRVVFVNESPVVRREDGLIPVRIITEHVDRTNDLVVVRGGRYANYTLNPSVLYEHIGNTMEVDGQISFPVAQCVKLWIEETAEGDELHGLDRPEEGDEHPVGQLVASMVRRGMINGISVALLPIAWDDVPVTQEMVQEGKAYPFLRTGEDRPLVRVFREWEKLEHSFVIIPANGRTVVMKSLASRGAIDYLMRELDHVIAPHVSPAVKREVSRIRKSALTGEFDVERFREVSANELIETAIRRETVRG